MKIEISDILVGFFKELINVNKDSFINSGYIWADNGKVTEQGERFANDFKDFINTMAMEHISLKLQANDGGFFPPPHTKS